MADGTAAMEVDTADELSERRAKELLGAERCVAGAVEWTAPKPPQKSKASVPLYPFSLYPPLACEGA